MTEVSSAQVGWLPYGERGLSAKRRGRNRPSSFDEGTNSTPSLSSFEIHIFYLNKVIKEFKSEICSLDKTWAGLRYVVSIRTSLRRGREGSKGRAGLPRSTKVMLSGRFCVLNAQLLREGTIFHRP